MYKIPRGFLASIVNSLAMVTLMGIIIYVIFDIYISWANTLTIPSDMNNTPEVLTVILSDLLLLLIFLPIIVFFSKMFPSIRVTPEGLKCLYLGFWRDFIPWHEVEEIDQLKHPRNYCYIAISRKGFFLINGLWANMLYGLIFCGQPVPIVIIYSDLRKGKVV